MSNRQLTMRQIREILRLYFEQKLSHRAIHRSLNLGVSTVGEVVRRASVAGYTWPLPEALTDTFLEERLYRSLKSLSHTQVGELDWPKVHLELKRKGVTLMLLWQEYQEKYSEGLGYSQFCERYRLFKKTLDVWMHQTHKAGEKAFVDYAGMTLSYIDVATGEICVAQIFVGVLGASNYTFVEATRSQSLPDWIGSHVRMFEFFGGVPEIVVPDNLKSGIDKPNRYEPLANRTYLDLSKWYSFAIIPARVARPKDKPKAEQGVLQTERQILAPLRERTFFGLHEINEAIDPLLLALNGRPFQKLPGSRLSQFAIVDKPVLKPLPKTPYVFCEWLKVKAGPNYHVLLEEHYYSIPYNHYGKELWIKYT